MAATPPPSTVSLTSLLPRLVSALGLILVLLVGTSIFLLVAAVNGNAAAATYLTAVVAWLTGGTWGQIALYALLVLVPSPIGSEVLAALKGGATTPLAADLTPLVQHEVRALQGTPPIGRSPIEGTLLGLPIQVDSTQAEAAINHLLSALLDAHSSTDSLTEKLQTAADKAVHASIMTLPAMQPTVVSVPSVFAPHATPGTVTITSTAGSNPVPPDPPQPEPAATTAAPVGPLSVPASVATPQS